MSDQVGNQNVGFLMTRLKCADQPLLLFFPLTGICKMQDSHDAAHLLSRNLTLKVLSMQIRLIHNCSKIDFTKQMAQACHFVV